MNKIIFMLIIYNIFVLVCFTILAIAFNSWWIILFSALFLSYFNKVSGKEELDSFTRTVIPRKLSQILELSLKGGRVITLQMLPVSC